MYKNNKNEERKLKKNNFLNRGKKGSTVEIVNQNPKERVLKQTTDYSSKADHPIPVENHMLYSVSTSLEMPISYICSLSIAQMKV